MAKWIQVWSSPLLSMFLPYIAICFPISSSLSVSPSPLACRTGGREEWTVKGADPLLSLLLLYSRSVSLFLALSALQSPLSTLITYINMSKKKTVLWICLCVHFREREGDRVCLCVCVCAQTQVNNQTEQWLLGRCITTNGFLVQQTREEPAFTAWLPWTLTLTWRMEGGGDRNWLSACLCMLSSHNGRDEWSRRGKDRTT